MNWFRITIDPRAGQRLLVQFGSGPNSVAKITQVDESTVTLDANHPLAGMSLIVDVNLTKIV